jgi:hypothetical protein
MDLSLLAFKREKLAGRQTEGYSRCFNLNQPNRASNRAQLPCPNRVARVAVSFFPLVSKSSSLLSRPGHNSVNHRWSCEPQVRALMSNGGA